MSFFGPHTPVMDIAVSGGTPGANSNDYTLFDSTTAFGAKQLPMVGIQRIALSLTNNQSGTLKAYRSTDGGTNWEQYDSQSVSASTSTAINGPYDYDVSTYKDWKLVWTNGGSAQTTWRPELKGYADRTPGA